MSRRCRNAGAEGSQLSTSQQHRGVGGGQHCWEGPQGASLWGGEGEGEDFFEQNDMSHGGVTSQRLGRRFSFDSCIFYIRFAVSLKTKACSQHSPRFLPRHRQQGCCAPGWVTRPCRSTSHLLLSCHGQGRQPACSAHLPSEMFWFFIFYSLKKKQKQNQKHLKPSI